MYVFVCLYIFIINHHHLYQVALPAWISPTPSVFLCLSLSLPIRPDHPSLPVGLSDYILYLRRGVVGMLLLVCHHWRISLLGVYRRTPLMSSFLLPQQYLTCLVHLIWMVLEMGGKCPYHCYFVGCCFQKMFNIARSILVKFLSSFSSIHFVSAHMVYPYSSIDTTTSRKKFRFILSIRSDLTKLKHYYIVWNEPLQALASISVQIKLNTCALIKQATFPHSTEPLWNWLRNSPTEEAVFRQPKRTSTRG